MAREYEKIYELKTYLDADGQMKHPTLETVNGWVHKTVDELSGMIRGIIADGELTNHEVEAVFNFLNSRNPEELRQWPLCDILARLHRIFEDGQVTKEELTEAAYLFYEILGDENYAVRASTDLPLDDPQPTIFWNNSFCVTGKFAFGTRNEVKKIIIDKGGSVHDRVTLSTGYLLIGTLSSRDWKHSTFGNKIQQAVKYREKQGRPAIISEHTWRMAIEEKL